MTEQLRHRSVGDHEFQEAPTSECPPAKNLPGRRKSYSHCFTVTVLATGFAVVWLLLVLLSWSSSERDDGSTRLPSLPSTTHRMHSSKSNGLQNGEADEHARPPLMDHAGISAMLETFRTTRKHRTPVPVQVSLVMQAEPTIQSSEATMPAADNAIEGTLGSSGDIFGAMTLDGVEKLSGLLGIGGDDHIASLGDGQTLLILALLAAPATAYSLTDVPKAHALVVNALQHLKQVSHSSEEAQRASTTITARWERTGLLGHSSTLGSTVLLLISRKWNDEEAFRISRSWANLLPPGAAVVTLQRWSHCHAGFVGPLVQTRVPFTRLPNGGQVFVYLVSPRLAISEPVVKLSETNVSVFESIVPSPALEGKLVHLQSISETDAREWVGKYFDPESTRTLLWGRLRTFFGVPGGYAWLGMRNWALGRLLGNASTPLDCVFRDLFVRATQMQHPSKILDKEIQELGGKRTTYSEFEPASLDKLFAEVALEAGDVFVDLGYGLGKTLFQAAMNMAISARGVELSPTRHKRSQDAWTLLQGAERQELGGLDSGSLEAPRGTVALHEGDFLKTEDSLWESATFVLHNVIVQSASQEELFYLGVAAQQLMMPGTVLVTLNELPGCHRALRLVRKSKVHVDWSTIAVAAYTYVVSARPPSGALVGELISPLTLSGALPRDFRCLSVAAMAADVNGRLDSQLADNTVLPKEARAMTIRTNKSIAWLRTGWLRGDELSTWDCFFKDAWFLLALRLPASAKAAFSQSWRDSTSVNRDATLDNLNWTGLGGPRTYGEARPSSIATLLESLKLSSNDVFYDLGSGLGKVVLQAHLQTPVRRAVGIELETSRHDAAGHALAQLRHLGVVDSERELKFILGDVTDTTLWSDATLVFMLCTCFPEEVLQAIAAGVAALPVGTRLVAASFEIHSPAAQSDGQPQKQLKLKDHMVLPTTFSDGEPFYIYEVVSAVG